MKKMCIYLLFALSGSFGRAIGNDDYMFRACSNKYDFVHWRGKTARKYDLPLLQWNFPKINLDTNDMFVVAKVIPMEKDKVLMLFQGQKNILKIDVSIHKNVLDAHDAIIQEFASMTSTKKYDQVQSGSGDIFFAMLDEKWSHVICACNNVKISVSSCNERLDPLKIAEELVRFTEQNSCVSFAAYDVDTGVKGILEKGGKMMQERKIASGKGIKTCSLRNVPKDICVSNAVYSVNDMPHKPEYGLNVVYGRLFELATVRNDIPEKVADGLVMAVKDVQTARKMAFGLYGQYSSMPTSMVANSLDIETSDEILVFGFAPREDSPNMYVAVYRNIIVRLQGLGDMKSLSMHLLKACCPQVDFSSVKPLPKEVSPKK